MKVTAREARARIAELLTAVEQGESVEITRHGRVVARMTSPAMHATKEERRAARRRLRATMPTATESATEIVRALRDER